MTDEQVQQIVDALSGDPFEPWLTAAIAVLSVLLGFGLSQWSEARSRANARADQATVARAAAVEEAATLAIQSMSDTADVVRERPRATLDLIPGVVYKLHTLDPSAEVGNWWFRQMKRANSALPTNRDYTDEESSFRGQIAASVMFRMTRWRDGKVSASEFAKEHDAAWDESFGIPPTPEFFKE